MTDPKRISPFVLREAKKIKQTKQDDTRKPSNFHILDDALLELSRVSGMLGVAKYLIGGHERALEGFQADFEVTLCDLRERIDHTSELISGISVD